MAECDHWERVERAEPDNLLARMKAVMFLLRIKKRQGIRPHVESARQNWLQRRRGTQLQPERQKQIA
ncbi:hypothetical protein [Komagataeibacter europaeus]|uniref:hypothetical protein n=1 Tax=Komagataeibacter europaeus TaxID=33995 RepID=UPI000474CDCD|nr:hypothetical protein [Komagataeibacter europaeus]GBQ46511.1 hypothetical protein AA18890_2623 [Komagataeibacter europaeus LMG 18890]